MQLYLHKLEKISTLTVLKPLTSQYRCDRLSYEATDVGSWTFVGTYEPTRTEGEVLYEIFHIHYSRAHYNPQMSSSQRQWPYSSVG